MAALHDLSAVELIAAYRRKALSPREVAQAVLDHIASIPGVDATYHLGDLVGYAPWPDETVALIRSHGIDGVSGNYDSTVANDYKHCGCKYEDPEQEALSHVSFAWTKEHTSRDTSGYSANCLFDSMFALMVGTRAVQH